MDFSIGNSDFKTILQNGNYVDKTAIIEEILEKEKSGAIIVALRPRRFGKSLMVSMLKTFFDEKEDADPYFKGLYIASSPAYKRRNSVPVISLSFKNADTDSIEGLLEKVRLVFANEFSRFDLQKRADCLTPQEQLEIEHIINGQQDKAAMEDALYLLCKLTSLSSKKKCFVLIDEYDLPIFNAFLLRDEDGTASGFFKRLYNTGLKGNEYVAFALLTGVMNSAKDSLSSGLNNVILDNGLYTAFNHEYFAFNEEEVRALIQKSQTKANLEEIKKWYGGYILYDTPHFNPWSIVNYFGNKGKYLVYWASTGSSAMIYRILSDNRQFAPGTLLRLMNGEGIEMSSDFSISFADMNDSLHGALVEFCALGYLTCHYDAQTKRITALIPNAEVLQVFQNEIKNRFLSGQIAAMSPSSFREAFLRGGKEGVTHYLKYLLSSLSAKYFADESRYQVMVLVLATLLFDDCIVREEAPSGEGISDILICPRHPGCVGAVIELKHLKSRTTDERLEKSAKDAIDQIQKRDYGEILHAYQAAPIIFYGISCAGKKVSVQVKLAD